MQRSTRPQRNVPVLALWNLIAFCAQHSEAFHQFDARFGWHAHGTAWQRGLIVWGHAKYRGCVASDQRTREAISKNQENP